MVTARIRFCSAIALLAVCAGAAPSAPAPAAGAKPVSPSEIASGLSLSTANSFVLSPDGRWLTLSTTKGPSLYDARNDRFANVKNNWLVNGNMPLSAWSPDGSTLVMSVLREGKRALALWKPGTNELRELLENPRNLEPGLLPPVWSADGKTLYLVIHQALPWNKLHPDDDNPPWMGNNVYVSSSGPYKQELRKVVLDREYPQAVAEDNRSLILALDVSSGRMGVVAKGNDIDSIYLSPDSSQLVAVQKRTNPFDDDAIGWQKQRYADVYLIDVPKTGLPAIDLSSLEDRRVGWSDAAGKRLEPVLKNAKLNISGFMFDPISGYNGAHGHPLICWSPDGKGFVYAPVGKQATGDIYWLDRKTRQSRNLTEKVTLAASAKSLGYAAQGTVIHDTPKFAHLFNPLWLPDSGALVAIGQGDVWLIPLDETRPPRKLTEQLPQESVRIVSAPQAFRAAVNAAGRITVIAKDRESRHDSVWQIDPVSGELVRITDTGVWIDLAVGTDERAERLMYTGQSSTTEANLFALDLQAGAAPKNLTKFKPQLAERAFPESRVLQWTTADGYPAYGLLYLPQGASSTNKVPLVFDGYPAQDLSRLDVRELRGARFYDDSLHGLLQEGMAVLFADIPMSDDGVYQKPMQQMVDGANRAVEAALATGVIDEKRMGIMGSSYGGLMVYSVLTQSKRFKVAASISGLANLFADYGTPNKQYYYELGQGRFEVPLWKDPQRYVENSPISQWDKIETPLLIVHGGEDSLIPQTYAWEAFSSLQRQKKYVLFALYPRMGHGANIEATRRIRGWFRQHLLGGEAITQTAEQESFFFGGVLSDDAPAPPPPSAAIKTGS